MDQGVWITGLGLVTPLGGDVTASWRALIHPPSLKDFIPEVADGQPAVMTGSLPEAAVDYRHLCSMGFSRAKAIAAQASHEALEDAGLWKDSHLTGSDPERCGCAMSASKPLFEGERVIAPDELNRAICVGVGLRGEARNVIAACATGAYAVALGASWIEAGLCDVVLAGSAEPYPNELIQAGFRRMGVISQESVMRPFDLCRSGFVFGEGCGAVVLEAEGHARARGAKPYARLSGWGLGADGHSPVAFNSGGERIAVVITRALERAGLPPRQIGHVNAHGTATRLNDCLETQALEKAFGRHAARLMISATKAGTGHLLGAAGSVELVWTVLALRDQFVPPTNTLETPDPDCRLDYTAGRGHPAAFEHAMSLSFGFGGPIGALVVSAC